MSETTPQHGSSDEFDKIMAENMSTHEGFSGALEDLDAADTKAHFAELSAKYERAFGLYEAPHIEDSLDEVADEIHSIFTDLCQEHGINPNTLKSLNNAYAQISQDFNEKVAHLGDKIEYGDIIVAHDAVLLELGDRMRILSISGDSKLVGTFVAPITGPMPDEADAIILNGPKELAVRVGFLLVDPILINQTGEIEHHAFESNQVIVTLGITGARLAKYSFPENS